MNEIGSGEVVESIQVGVPVQFSIAKQGRTITPLEPFRGVSLLNVKEQVPVI